MITLKFRPPNFRCEVEFGTCREWCLVYGADEAAARARFAEAGYLVRAVESYDFDTCWKSTAAVATNAVLAKGKPTEWDNTIWRDIKGYLFLISHGKCGYCETPVRPASKGEVEHYRPKGKVTGDTPAEQGHTGYYWLAYDVSNYIPTCSSCNTGKGKKNQFPIAGTRAQFPTDSLALENPLLLNPFADKPSEHLKVQVCENPLDPNQALVITANGSQRGETSRKVYDLNRGDLLAARRIAMQNAECLFLCLQVDSVEAKERLKQVVEGREAYTAAMLAKLVSLCTKKEDELVKMRRALEQ